MDSQRKLLIGYDLCDDITQISCYSYKTYEPISISLHEGQEDYAIPTVLGIREDTKMWLIGQEAVDCAGKGEGILIKSLLTRIRDGENIEIYRTVLTPLTLLEKYFRKTLTLVKNYFPTEPITKIAVTIRDMEPKVVNCIYEALALLGIEKDRAAVIGHADAYLYYTLSQDKSLWMNDVGLFDFNEQSLSYYQMGINRRTSPMIAGLTKRNFTDTLNYGMLKEKLPNIAYTFENIANLVLHKQIISTLYFTGKGFENGWAEEILKKLCVGRRVFLGQNLYTKGACYAAKELSGDRKLENYILLNDDMITSSIAISVYADARIKEVMLTEAAIPWYEVNQDLEVIPDEGQVIEIILCRIITRETIREKLILDNLPKRPNRMTRLGIHVTCLSRTTAKITVKDLGFGEFYPATDATWEFELEI